MASLTNSQINSKSMNGLINVEANSGTFDELDVNSLNILVSGIAPTVSALSNDTNIATTAWVNNHASGNYVDLVNNQTIVSGIKTFNTLPQSSVVPTLGDELVNKNFTDATYVDLVNNETIGGIKTFTSLPQSSVVPTLGNQLVNKTYVDSVSISPLATNNVWTGTNAFNTYLPTSTLTPSSNTQLTTKLYVDDADTIVFGLCAKLASNNTFTGTTNRFEGLNGVRSGTSTNYASLTQNGGQSILNAFGASTNVLYLQTNGSSNMTFGESGGIKYGINSGDFYNTTGDMFINQTTYPSTNTSQLGYNKTETLTEFTFTADTLGTIGSFTVPSKGVWICNISVKYRTTGGAGSFENNQLFLTDSASGTTAYKTFEYFDETDIVVGTNGKRFVHSISGTLNTTASQTFYIRGLNDTTGITTLAEAIYSYTRVG